MTGREQVHHESAHSIRSGQPIDKQAAPRRSAEVEAKNTIRAERLLLAGPAGPLEALLEHVPGAQPALGALVCHPHPVYGGTMHNKVVFRIAKAALALNLPTLRFNFRGAGKSEGRFDHGAGERDDVRAALDFLCGRFPGLRVVMMGFSFGAWVGLAVGAEEPRVAALVGLGLPVGSLDFKFLARVTKPKLILQGTEDVYGPRDRVERLYTSLSEPKRIQWVEGADHFFTGRLDRVQASVTTFLEELAAG